MTKRRHGAVKVLLVCAATVLVALAGCFGEDKISLEGSGTFSEDCPSVEIPRDEDMLEKPGYMVGNDLVPVTVQVWLFGEGSPHPQAAVYAVHGSQSLPVDDLDRFTNGCILAVGVTDESGRVTLHLQRGLGFHLVYSGLGFAYDDAADLVAKKTTLEVVAADPDEAVLGDCGRPERPVILPDDQQYGGGRVPVEVRTWQHTAGMDPVQARVVALDATASPPFGFGDLSASWSNCVVAWTTTDQDGSGVLHLSEDDSLNFVLDGQSLFGYTGFTGPVEIQEGGSVDLFEYDSRHAETGLCGMPEPPHDHPGHKQYATDLVRIGFQVFEDAAHTTAASGLQVVALHPDQPSLYHFRALSLGSSVCVLARTTTDEDGQASFWLQDGAAFDLLLAERHEKASVIHGRQAEPDLELVVDQIDVDEVHDLDYGPGCIQYRQVRHVTITVTDIVPTGAPMEDVDVYSIAGEPPLAEAQKVGASCVVDFAVTGPDGRVELLVPDDVAALVATRGGGLPRAIVAPESAAVVPVWPAVVEFGQQFQIDAVPGMVGSWSQRPTLHEVPAYDDALWARAADVELLQASWNNTVDSWADLAIGIDVAGERVHVVDERMQEPVEAGANEWLVDLTPEIVPECDLSDPSFELYSESGLGAAVELEGVLSGLVILGADSLVVGDACD